jgi:Omp85 superfamily domain
MRQGRRSSLVVLFANVVLVLASAPGLFGQDAAVRTAEVAQSSPQDPAPSPATDDRKTATKERLIDRLRIRLEGHEQHISGPGPGLGARGFHPLVGVIVPGSGLSTGLDYQDLRLGGSPIGLDAAAEVSYGGFQVYRLQVGFLEHRDTTETLQPVDAKVTSLFNDHASKSRGVAAFADLRYLRYPAAVFYGVGPGARRVDGTDYLLLGALVDGVVQYQFTRNFGVSGRVGWLAPGLGGGPDQALQTRFDAGTAPGLADVPDFLTTGVAAVFDARDEPSDPHRGNFLGAAVWRFDGLGGKAYDFVRVTGDARWYHPLFDPRGVLALRALASAETPGPGAKVPFYLEQTLGGNEILRGFAPHRFRDRALAALSAEYRWRMNSYLDVGPFVDAGTVGPGLAKLAVRNLEVSGGVRAGLRYKGRVLFHFGWGYGREGQRVFLGAGTVF